MRAAPEPERSAGTKTNPVADRIISKQGQYLAFIYNYTVMNGRAPAEADLERFFRTTYPTIHQMILKLEEKGLISRAPGQARSIKLLVDRGEIPRLLPPEEQKRCRPFGSSWLDPKRDCLYWGKPVHLSNKSLHMAAIPRRFVEACEL
jgi:repressor LexA